MMEEGELKLMKRLAVWVSLFLLVFSPACLGATPSETLDIQEIMRQGNTMRQNVAWLTVGLDGLLKTKERKLQLTSKQKKQILPIMQGLIREKLILLKPEAQPDGRTGQQQARRQTQQTQGQIGQQWRQIRQGSGLNPGTSQIQAGVKKLQQQITFGNSQADRVDAILTPNQVSYIDNLDFKPEKYGFVSRQQFGNTGINRQNGSAGTQSGQSGQYRQSGQSGQTGQTWRSTGNRQTGNQTLQKQIEAGRALLIKINNEVMTLLRK